MNSMNNTVNAVVEDIRSKFSIQNMEYPAANQIALDLDPRDVHGVLSYVKSIGWRQLSLLTCVDWIERKVFQLVYIVFNWEKGIVLQIRTEIHREDPYFRTITNIYPGAVYYERDVHEFFGVRFEGNDNASKPLFLEIWDDIPPMRKDFDPEEYSRKKYPAREYNSDFGKKAGEEQ